MGAWPRPGVRGLVAVAAIGKIPVGLDSVTRGACQPEWGPASGCCLRFRFFANERYMYGI